MWLMSALKCGIIPYLFIPTVLIGNKNIYTCIVKTFYAICNGKLYTSIACSAEDLDKITIGQKIAGNLESLLLELRNTGIWVAGLSY